ncbi:MAG TPA: hypothetical protein VHO01_07875 [Jatrophihabitans sp.]|nr:hypothetical protein [Jatrophihabitans sp.]
MSAASADPSSQPSAADAQSAPDETAAMQIAQLYGHDVSVSAETDVASMVVAHPDGSLSLSASPVPVRAQGPDGSWAPLNLSLQPDGSQLTPQTAAVPVKFSAGGGAAPLAQIQAASGDWLSESWTGGALPTPTVSGSSATYSEVMPGVDLVVTATAVGMSEVLVVKSAAAASDPGLAAVSFGIDDGPMNSKVNADGSLTTASDGKTQLVSVSPTWWDSSSAGASAAGPGGMDLPTPIAHSDTTTSITVNAASVLSTPGVVYPVYVDPPAAFEGDKINYTFTDSTYPTTSYWNGSGASDAYAHVGYIDVAHSTDPNAHLTRSYWTLNTAALNGKYIHAAKFSASEVYSSSCTPTDVELWTTSAISSSTTAANPPTLSDKIATTAMAHGWNSSCPAASVGWDVTAAVQRAADAQYGAISLGLKASTAGESDWQSWKKFQNDPYLDVSFYTRPGVPFNRAVSGCYAVCGLGAVTRLASPRLSAQSAASTTYVSNIYYNFEVYTTAVNPPALVTSGRAADTAVGTTATWGLGVTLADNGQYEYHAQGCIGGEGAASCSDWSGWFPFSVDLTRPPAPTLSPVAGDFQFFAPSDPVPTVRTGQQGQPGAVVISDSTTPMDVYQYVYTPESSLSVTSDNAPACNSTTGDVVSVCGLDASGSVQVNITPQEFTSNLSLVAIDKAGNASDGRTYTYYPKGTVANQAQHVWLMPGSGSGNTVADGTVITPSPAQNLNLATGITWGSPMNPYFSWSYKGFLNLGSPGVVQNSLAATTAAVSDVPADAAHSMTAAIWVKPMGRVTGDAPYQTVLSQDGPADSAFYIQRTPSEQWRVCMPQDQTDTAPIDCTTPASSVGSGWMLLIMVWDAPTHQLSLYVSDAVNPPVGQVTHVSSPPASSGAIAVGRAWYHHGLTDWYHGSLADPMFWPVALSASEINTLHTQFGGRS